VSSKIFDNQIKEGKARISFGEELRIKVRTHVSLGTAPDIPRTPQRIPQRPAMDNEPMKNEVVINRPRQLLVPVVLVSKGI
jgi:hypothetical protein